MLWQDFGTLKKNCTLLCLNELWKNNCKQHLKTKNIKQNNVLGFESQCCCCICWNNSNVPIVFTIYSKIVKFCETKNLNLRREKLYKVERERKREREQELKIKHKYLKMKHFQHNYLKIKHLLLFCFFFFVVYLLLLCFWKNESWNTSWINICCLNFSISWKTFLILSLPLYLKTQSTTR